MKYIIHYIRPHLGRMTGGLFIKFLGTIPLFNGKGEPLGE